MSDKPETLAALVAQMRSWFKEGVTLVNTGYIADRIEAAAKNAENAFGMALAIEDGLHKRDKQSAPGNAAALREALERIRPLVRAAGVTPYVPERKELVDGALGIIDAALAAPARNCDQFATVDESREAFQKARGHKILADVELWDSMDEAGALVRWLFAPAEGKEDDHA